jgi:hypothetical protein
MIDLKISTSFLVGYSNGGNSHIRERSLKDWQEIFTRFALFHRWFPMDALEPLVEIFEFEDGSMMRSYGKWIFMFFIELDEISSVVWPVLL